MLSSKCAVCNFKKSRFIKQQEVSRLLSTLPLKTSSSKVSLLSDILYKRYKMNEMINKSLLAGNTFMIEIHLKQLFDI